jgi:hypothetical protein
MKDKTIEGITKILKYKGREDLAKYLNNSYCRIEESTNYGSYLFSVLSTLEIYSSLENHTILSDLNDSNVDVILDAVLKIIPPKPHGPEITNIRFLLDTEIEDVQDESQDSYDFISFWNAFKAYIKEIIHKDGYLNSFGGSNQFTHKGGFYFEINESDLNNKIMQELGISCYPFNNKPEDEIILKLVTFFFQNVETPDGDRGKATLNYTISINRLFKNFNIPFQLKKGEIIRKGDIVFDKIYNICDFNIVKKDPDLLKLLNESIKYFIEPNHYDIDTALEKIADALDRIKTLMEPKNKKLSIQKTIELLSADEDLRKFVDKHLKTLTEISNNFTIRHKEINKKNIDSEEYKEFLFYEYFNVIRLLLLNLSEKKHVF